MLFFFNDTATTEIYTLSLHDALPISVLRFAETSAARAPLGRFFVGGSMPFAMIEIPADKQRQAYDDYVNHPSKSVLEIDRKSTRLNSSHANISYAVFCLKKKNSLTSR